MSESHPPLIAIVGPTGVGKTAAAIHLAQAINGEVVSADSRQFYRRMDIGTAKPTQSELQTVPHHLIDVLDPHESLSLAQFQRMANQVINSVQAAGKIPLLVGGTGQYVRAVIEGWGIPEVPPHPELRADLEAFAELYGSTTLHDWLRRIDPSAAQELDWRNVRRVVRAVEVWLVAGMPISALQAKTPPAYRILTIGLTRPRDDLYALIDARIDKMVEQGFVQEVERLLDKGYQWDLPAMSSLGYPQIGSYLRGEISLDDAIVELKRDTRRFIRHQYNWFRLDDPSIMWFDLSTASPVAIGNEVSAWLNG